MLDPVMTNQKVAKKLKRRKKRKASAEKDKEALYETEEA